VVVVAPSPGPAGGEHDRSRPGIRLLVPPGPGILSLSPCPCRAFSEEEAAKGRRAEHADGAPRRPEWLCFCQCASSGSGARDFVAHVHGADGPGGGARAKRGPPASLAYNFLISFLVLVAC
jgi:hypothetical protein